MIGYFFLSKKNRKINVLANGSLGGNSGADHFF
jgi:hypothetical protein